MADRYRFVQDDENGKPLVELVTPIIEEALRKWAEVMPPDTPEPPGPVNCNCKDRPSWFYHHREHCWRAFYRHIGGPDPARIASTRDGRSVFCLGCNCLLTVDEDGIPDVQQMREAEDHD